MFSLYKLKITKQELVVLHVNPCSNNDWFFSYKSVEIFSLLCASIFLRDLVKLYLNSFPISLSQWLNESINYNIYFISYFISAPLYLKHHKKFHHRNIWKKYTLSWDRNTVFIFLFSILIVQLFHFPQFSRHADA